MSYLGHFRNPHGLKPALRAATHAPHLVFPLKALTLSAYPTKRSIQMSGLKILIPISLTLALSACETREEFAIRLTQFDGKTLAQVTSIIGPPTLQNKTTAVWFHESTHTEYRPHYRPYRYGHRYGRGFGYGYGHSYTYRLNCTFTATLKAGRVMDSTYKGNDCQRFAPKPKKKPNT